MERYDDNKVISGTHGRMWLDDNEIQEITSLKANITLKTETIAQAGCLMDGEKVVGIECKGELKANKINSRWIQMLSENYKKGKNPSFTIISLLSDPGNGGSERVKLKGVTFSELPLVDWELKKICEDGLNFTFRDWELLDSIK